MAWTRSWTSRRDAALTRVLVDIELARTLSWRVLFFYSLQLMRWLVTALPRFSRVKTRRAGGVALLLSVGCLAYFEKLCCGTWEPNG